jgi:hypothetical protein
LIPAQRFPNTSPMPHSCHYKTTPMWVLNLTACN